MNQTSIIQKRAAQEEAHRFFDQLEPVTVGQMAGNWKGREWKTGHPMEGLLEHANWYGKSFAEKGDAHPLVFQKKNGKLYNLNPDFIPARFPLDKIPKKLIKPGLTVFYPLLSTKKSKAQLRMVDYRGKVSAAMVYDRVAIIDYFRKIDEDTLLGLMEYKGQASDKSYFFILERDTRTSL